MSDSRRDFLKKAALLSGAAGLSSMLPESIQKALAIEPAVGSTYQDAEHIVILMQENRSFDHCFGMMRGVRGFNDPRAIDLPDQNKVWLQSNPKGETFAPFHLDIKNTKATWMGNLPHSWDNQVNARNDGKFNEWLKAKHPANPAYSNMPLTLGYHTRNDIPFYYAFADAFTVCDQNFSSSLTGTNPNRLYFWTGTIREKQDESAKANVWNEDVDYETLHWHTFPESLEDNGISWKCYQNEVSLDVGFKGEEDSWLSNFQDNDMEFFAQYHVKLHQPYIDNLHRNAASLVDEITALQQKLATDPASDKLKKDLTKKQSDLTGVTAEMEKYQTGMFEKLSQREQNLHNKAFVTNKNDPDYHTLANLKYDDNGTEREMQVPKGDVLYQFRQDVQTGKLPTVSWLTAPENFSDHPASAWYGSWYVSEVLDILTQNPEVWKKTIFILTYDENDGYFDHIPPFVPPNSHKPGTGKVSEGIDTRAEFVTLDQELDRKNIPKKYDRESPIGLGYRVPMVIASPWSKGGWVNSEVFDHTSTLQFLEKFLSKKTGKDIREPNINDWRRTVCGDLTSAFRPYHGEKIGSPAPVKRDVFFEGIHNAKFKQLPSGYKALTKDEVAQINNGQSSPYMPVQEAGVKPSCAIPYELYVNGGLNKEKTAFKLDFKAANKVFGKTAIGAAFNVYAPGKYLPIKGDAPFEAVRTWAYGVKAGDTLTDNWPLNEFENDQYHLRVYGPNGFYREFKGDKNDPSVNLECWYQHNASQLTGNIDLGLVSLSGNYEIEIIDNAYKKPSVTTTISGIKNEIGLIIDLKSSSNWYDFTITVKGYPEFERRYAGRVETGKPGISDPFMGRVLFGKV